METSQSGQSSILLVGAEHTTFQWLGLRASLPEHSDLRVLADVHQAAEATQLAAAQHPDHVLIDADVGGMGVVPLARVVHRASPTSRVMVVGTREALRRDALAQLMELGVRGYLLWEGLSGEAVVRCLAVTREDDLLVGHQAILGELVAVPERRRPLRNDEPSLTDDERTALSLLIEGLRQEEIAGEMLVSVMSVRRLVAALRDKFGVGTTNALCWRAGQLGFVPHGGGSGRSSHLSGSDQGSERNRSKR